MSDCPTTLALIGVGGTLGGALGGGWLTWWLSHKTEDRQWRRQQRLDAYSDVLRAYQTLIAEAVKAYDRELRHLDDVKTFEPVIEGVHALYHTANRVALLGSQVTRGSLNALTARCGTVIAKEAMIRPHTLSPDAWKHVIGEGGRLNGEFLAAARTEMHIDTT